MAIDSYLEAFSYETLLNDALKKIPNTIDKREGSIIYDALAPACAELAQAYINLRGILLETYVLTAQNEYLELRCLEQGLTRIQATKAVRKGSFFYADNQPAKIPLGARFSTISTANPIIYAVTGAYEDENGIEAAGFYQLTCETPGIIGNSYIGNLLPVTFIPNLAVATIDDILFPARDTETDEELRTRYLETVNNKAFGGNIAQYAEEVRKLSGVGQCQIYPVWNGGGTVKVSILGADYMAASPILVEYVQDRLDPRDEDNPGGKGLGLAPIGHQVTVCTAEPFTIEVQADIKLKQGYHIGQVESFILQNLADYFLELRKAWGTADELNNYAVGVYQARVNLAILTATGVDNVTNIRLNGDMKDILLSEKAELQEIPVLGAVTIHES